MQSKTERKMCGTCEYWSGNRELIFDQHSKLKINIYDKHALCNRQDYRFANKERDCQRSCGRYSKWSEIL